MVGIQKDAFWKAGIFTLVVFVLGVLLGLFLDEYRVSKVREDFSRVEIEWADAKIQSIYYQSMTSSFCEAAIKENLNFADRVYKEGLKIEQYENSNKLTKKMTIDKQKYALLKVEFWINSIILKKKCDANYVNLVYFYLNEPDFNQKIKQDTQSIILRDLKHKYGSDLMLIPLPIDLDISMINIMKDAYNITVAPTILLNEEIKLEGITKQEDLEKYLIKNEL